MISKLLQIAVAEIGTTECPADSNTVKYNTDYYGKEVCGSSYPWCAVFQWWIFNQSGLSDLFFGGNRTASCPTLYKYYKKEGQTVSDYQAGDLVFMNFCGGTTTQHVGIVESVRADGSLITIEGNTGCSSDDNGGAVMRRNRALKYIVCGARPNYTTEATATIADDEEITQDEFNKLMDAYLEQLGQQEPSEWSAGERERVEAVGLIIGDQNANKKYKSFATRESMAVMLARFMERVGK